MSQPAPDDTPEHVRDYEVPYRRVDHQHGDELYWDTDDNFPGQFPVGSMRADEYGWTPTTEERKRWKREAEERERRRIPIGFRAV